MNLMEFNKAECKVLQWSQGNSQYHYRLGAEWVENNPEEKHLGILVDENLDMSWQCAPSEQKANHIRPVSSSVILPLYSTLGKPHLEYSIQLWDPQYLKDMNGPARVDPEKGCKFGQKAGSPLL